VAILVIRRYMANSETTSTQVVPGLGRSRDSSTQSCVPFLGEAVYSVIACRNYREANFLASNRRLASQLVLGIYSPVCNRLLSDTTQRTNELKKVNTQMVNGRRFETLLRNTVLLACPAYLGLAPTIIYPRGHEQVPVYLSALRCTVR